MLLLLATTPTSATSLLPKPRGFGAGVLLSLGGVNAGSPQRVVSGHVGVGLSEYFMLREVVESGTACDLPGVSIKYSPFLSCMWKAVSKGFVDHTKATFVADGLRNGFMAGVDVSSLRGHRWFKNYPRALEFRNQVTTANTKRVQGGKTINLGLWTSALATLVRSTFDSSAIAPQNAVDKPLEPEAQRPCTDHTRTGLNAATSLDFLGHSLDTYNEIARFFKQDYFMHVSDVEAAFPMLPFHPSLWQYLMFRFFDTDDTDKLSLFMHVCGDFGTRGMPGVFKIFFSDVLVNMARCEQVLTLPMPIYVDDMGLIGPDRLVVIAEMRVFQEWSTTVCGVLFKIIKDRMASQCQLMIGFWWDSPSLTRTLPEQKLLLYLDMLLDFSTRPKLTLKDLQCCAGRMQRAIMTLPPGAACLLLGIFLLMAGLRLPWHSRRTNKGVRDDMKWLHKLLKINLGRGFYSLSNFGVAPETATDASKSKKYTGGGYVSACGRYGWFKYGTSAARHCIDFLEGDTFSVCFDRMGECWRQKIVPVRIDNQAFLGSLQKGRSKVERLNVLVREAFANCLRFQCILQPTWISSKDNWLADLLSRLEGYLLFVAEAYRTGFWSPDVVPQPHPTNGTVRVLPENRGLLAEGFDAAADAHRPCVEDPGIQFGKRVKMCACGGPATTHGCNMLAAPNSEYCNSCVWDSMGHGCFCSCYGCTGDEHASIGEKTNGETTKSTVARRGHRRVMPGMRTVIMFMLPLMQVVASAPGQSTGAADKVPYARASLLEGAPQASADWAREILDNRLSASSWRTVNAGLKLWRAVAEQNGWPAIISTDDPLRGGKLITWVHSMVADSSLTYKSIDGYIWGVRKWQELQEQADPTPGILGWHTFMQSVKVLTWQPGEPHKATPLDVIERIIDDTDQTDFGQVQLVVVMLTQLYTFSRSECPCPKSFTGADSFDTSKHWRVCDFDVMIICSLACVLVRFQAIKQDPRVERPRGRGDGDWSVVGAVVKNTKWCLVTWLVLLNNFHGPRADKEAPMFVDPRDRTRPYLYRMLNDDLVRRQKRVGVPEDELTHSHGLRVRGYNETKETLGKSIAGAHGGWAQKEDAEASGNSRYDRFLLSMVIRIAACIAHVDLGVLGESSEEPGSSVVPSGTIRERAAGPSSTRMTRHAVVPVDGDVDGDMSMAMPAALMTPTHGGAHRELPSGWTRERRVPPSGRAYYVYHGPDGERAQSLPAAWRVAADEDHGTDSDPFASEVEDEQEAVAGDEPVADAQGAQLAVSAAESEQEAVAGEEPVADAQEAQLAVSDAESDADEQPEVVEEQEGAVGPAMRRCGTLGCTYDDFHLGPHSFQLVDGPRRRNGLLGGPPLTAIATQSPPRI